MCKECDLIKGLSRREFLRYTLIGTGIAALGPFGKGLLPSANASPISMPPGGQNIFSIINLYGGNDGLNTVVPVTLNNYRVSRPALGLDPVADGLLSMNTGPNPTTRYMFHYNLPNIAQLWAEGSVAVIQKVGYPDGNLSHFLSQDIWSYGVRYKFSSLPIDRSGWIARFADLYTQSPTGAVSVYGGRPLDFVGGTTAPFQVTSLNRFDILTDNRYPNNHLHRVETIKKALAATPRTGLTGEAGVAISQAHDMAGLVQQAVASFTDPGTYDTSYNIGRYMKDIAILIEGGFDTRIFFTGFGGFDNHSDQNGGQNSAHPNLMQRLDDSVGAFAQNMKDLGVWNQMVIGIVTEFGRRNYENGSAGTDHARANALMLIGGAVNGGTYGPDLTEADLNDDPDRSVNPNRGYLQYEVDFRSIYKEVLSGHLGVDPDPIFPESQEKTGVLGIV